MSDTDRLRRHLDAGGEVWPPAWDGSNGPTPDKGKPVKRVAARILELREEGMVIVVRERRNQCAVYVKSTEPVVDAVAVEPEPSMFVHEHRLPSTTPALDALTILPPRATEEERILDAQLIANQAQREWRERQRQQQEAA